MAGDLVLVTGVSGFCDSDAMPWEPNGDSVRKILSRDETARSVVVRTFFPPSGSNPVPFRWYHRSVRETFLFLWGEYRGWEFRGPDDTEGRIERFARGTFMDRPPLSLHGRRPAPTATGCEFLMWTSHGGDFDLDENESFPLPNDVAPPPGLLFRSPDVVMTEAMPWRDHPRLPGAKRKEVSRGEAGTPPGHYPVTLVYLPPGWRFASDVMSDHARRWCYGLAGRMPLSLAGNVVKVRSGCFAEWRDSARVTVGERPVGEEGALLLCVGHDLSPVASG